MEKILNIEEISVEDDYSSYMAGYLIKTTEQEIKILIEDVQQCCENYGYITTNDSVEDFVGAVLLKIALTDSALNEAKLTEVDVDPGNYYWEGDLMFVNLETDKGTLQFVLYNDHNGYYSHRAIVSSTQLTEERFL